MSDKILYYGDNLSILRNEIKDESVDLIYLDPPFNSNANYNVLFREQTGKQSASQIEVFGDTWHWTREAENAFDEVMQSGNSNVSEMVRAMRSFLGENDMMAYLVMMAVRLIELRSVLKPDGSIYLHCDDTASHYIKLLMDAVFGCKNYRNNIVWRRATSHNDPSRFGRIADHILFYSKNENHFWDGYGAAELKTEEKIRESYPQQDERGYYRSDNLTGPLHGASKGSPSTQPWRDYDVHAMGRCWSVPKTGLYAQYIEENLLPGYLNIKGVHERLDALDKAGLIHHPQTSRGKWPGLKRYADADRGNPPQNIILEPIGFTNYNKGNEYLGYPTQKPLGLLEKIIKVSSKKGDTVLDPFCGCGTAVHAAEKLGRKWVGIDITHLAISLVERRLKDAFPKIRYEVHGTPKDLEGAKALAARDKYQFEWWALSLIDAVPYQGKKKGADGGIDGILYFQEDKHTTERLLVSVKGGANVGVSMIRDLKGTMEREKAPLGLLITLASPTAPMTKEAVASGSHTIYGEGRKYPKVQIATIEDLLNGKPPRLPVFKSMTFKKAPREKKEHRSGRLV